MSAGEPGLARALVDTVAAGSVETAYDQSTVVLDTADWVRAARAARDDLGCVLFDQLGASDAGSPGASGAAWDVVLHAVRPAGAAGVLLRTRLPLDGVLPSVTGVWAGAAWSEREVAEMTGLGVSGHPDLRPLLLAPGAGLHPLRKATVLVARGVRPWPGRLEPGESGESGESGEAGAGGTAAGRRRATAPGLPPEGWGTA